MQELKVKYIAEGLSYSRTQKLGEGAFGQVFLGFDDVRKVPCAFKIVNLQKVSAQVNAETLMKKIKDEIVNMQIARHPSIIEFYQAKQSPNNIYIMCEYCNGESLASYIQKREYLTQWEALQFFKEILQGFYHLRKNNIVHRDLKPANLLMHNYSIKIGDLGFSKVTEDHEQMLESIVGTPLYMSPQIFERQKYTEKTDIWSLGVILYEMLYGRNPWAGCKNLYELKERIKKQVNFPDFPIVSRSLKHTIRKMLVIKQAERINWQALFEKYLPNSQTQLNNQETVNYGSYVLSVYTSNYFRTSLYLQSYLQLPKIARQLNLISEQKLSSLLGKYSSSQQFYKQVLFLSQNKVLLKEYYNLFLEKRNQVSFVILLVGKILLVAQNVHLQLSVYCFCAALLGYRYALSILEEMIVGQNLALPHQNYFQVAQKFCYDPILFYLFTRDIEVIKNQYQFFMPHFQSVLARIQTHSIAAVIHKQLSGIYSHEDNQKRVIKFFYCNYLKKIFNSLKNILKKPESMIDEEQQINLKEDEDNPPPVDVTIVRMIEEYLSNGDLFKVSKAKGMKNLIQHMYDWQTTVKQHFYVKLLQSEPMRQDSIDSFLKKQFLWSKLNLSQLQVPPFS